MIQQRVANTFPSQIWLDEEHLYVVFIEPNKA